MNRSKKGCQNLLRLANRHPLPSPWWFRPAYHEPDYSRRFFLCYENVTGTREQDLVFFQSLVQPGQRLLDVGCGGGDFVLAMTRQVVKASGIDLGSYPIEQAQEKAREEGLEAEWICGNFIEMEIEQPFDWITLLGSQLQEFPPDELQQVLEQVHKALAAGGKFVSVVQRLNPAEREYSSYWYMPEQCLLTDKKALVLGENFYYPEERIRVLREYALEIQTGRLVCGGSTEKEYTPDELKDFAAEAGLSLEAVYGDYDRQPFTPDSLRLIVVMSKGDKTET